MEIILVSIRLGLAAIFGVAAFGKLIDREGSSKALRDFGMPEGLLPAAVFLLPLAELAIAFGLIFVETSWYSAIGGGALFAVFTGGMLYQIARGNAPDCHCFGQIHSEPVGISSVVRNLVFLALAIIMIVSGRANQGLNLANSNQEVMQILIGVAVIGLLAAAVYLLKKISDQQNQIMRRIEVLEITANEGGTIEREELSHPHDGLPIGGHFPDFELFDTSANLITSEQLKKTSVPTLFFFVSPTCNPCKALLPEIAEWRKQLLGKVNFIFISNGKAQANIDKFGEDPRLPILLQKEREIAETVNAKWTPTAILMDANGKVASHAAAGDSAIRKLVEQICSEDLSREFTYFAHDHDHGHSHNKIGENVPVFSLTDIRGKVVDTDYFLGKQTLVTFWSLTCPFCTTMMEELKTWDKTRGKDSPNLVIFSEGDAKAHEEFGLDAPIILDEGYKTASAFGMFGTPSAVLVNEEGKIVSETAVGAANIWSLVRKN